MKPAVIDWAVQNNESWPGAVTVRFVDGTVFDWSQYSAIDMQVKVDPTQPEPEFALSLGAGIEVRPGDNSTIDFRAAWADVKEFAGVYVYDIVGTHAGDKTVVVKGTIVVSNGVTR